MPKKDEKPEEKLVMVGDGAPEEETPQEEAPKEKEETPSEEPEEETPEKKDSPEEGSDERVGHSEDDDEDREQIRSRRREERKKRRERDARLRKEVNFLRNRNEQVERQLSQVLLRQDRQEEVGIDSRIGQFESQIKEAEAIHSRAVANKDGETATEALRVKDQLNEHLQRLKNAKASRAQKRPEEAEETSRQPNEGQRVALDWVKRNDWYDPSLRDETSHFVKVMEDRLAAEGEYRADEPEYWEELDRRVAKRFPHLKKASKVKEEEIFEDDDDEPEEKVEKRPAPKKKGGGPVFSVGGKARALRKNEVFINEQRKQALIEAGVWDDQEARERYLRSFQRYDQEAQNNS